MSGIGVWVVLIAAVTGAEPVGPPWPIEKAQPDGRATTGTSSTTIALAATRRSADRANLLAADGSFELGQPDWCRLEMGFDDLSAALALDEAHADHGRASARWLIEPEHEAPTLHMPLRLAGGRAGRTYCLSLALRASSPHVVMAAVSTGRSVELPEFTQWQVGPRWQRFSQAFALPTGSMTTCPTLILSTGRPRQPWVLWIDSLKVEAGSSATAYRPAAVPLIGTSFGRRSRLFFEGQPVRIAVGVQVPPGRHSGVHLHWALHGGGVAGRSGWVPLTGPITSNATLHAAPLPRGWYRVDLGLVDRAGRPLTRRSETFGVVRGISEAASDGFKLIVPSRGPRSDAIARRIGLTVARSGGPLVPWGGTTTSPATGRSATSRRARSLSSRVRVFAGLERIRELTSARAGGARAITWPTAWDELLDDHARWRAVAIGVNVWIDLLGDAVNLRRLRVNDGSVIIDVFSSQARHVAIVCPSDRTGSGARLEVPLPANQVTASDAYGVRLPIAGGDDPFLVELSPGLTYLVAGPNLTRGRFALQLEDARLLAPTTGPGRR